MAPPVAEKILMMLHVIHLLVGLPEISDLVDVSAVVHHDRQDCLSKPSMLPSPCHKHEDEVKKRKGTK